MKIGGLQPVTLLDYPQKVAAIVFTSGCNLRCPFCYNPSLVLPQLIKKSNLLADTELFKFLKKRRNFLDGLVITGGEPTVQTDLVDFCQRVKKLGYAIKLDTNGFSPQILDELIKNRLIDYIAMDIKAPLSRYAEVCGVKVRTDDIQSSLEIIKHSQLPYEFRSTLVKGLHRKADIIRMAKLAQDAPKYYLQNFNYQSRLVKPDFAGKFFTHQEMENMRQIVLKFVSDCQIR